MNLHEYLEEQHKTTDYIPPYGTQLTVRDFSPVVFDSGQYGLSVEAYSSEGKRSIYELEVVEYTSNNHALAVCRRDGESVDYIHPWVHRNHGTETLLVAWYDWVLTQDAECRPRPFNPQRPWEDETIEAQLYRAEHGVVAYQDFHTNSANVSSVVELQEWFDENSQDSPVRFKVLGLKNAEALTEDGPLKLRCMGFTSGQDTLTTKPLGELQSLPSYEDDLAHTNSGLPPEYGLNLMMDGENVDSFHGDWLPIVNDILDYMSDDPETRPDWFGVVPHGLNAALLIPAMYAVITLHFDDDGAAVRLGVRSDSTVASRARHEQRHQRRWGRWLDKDAQLTSQELDAGLDEVTQALEELMTSEEARAINEGASDDATH